MEKSGILLVASINSFHGNVLPEGFARLYEERLSLGQIAKSGIPMTINSHGIDFLMYPWLNDFVDCPNLEFTYGLFTQILPVFLSEEYLVWQHALGDVIHPNISQIFYPEFCTPASPQENFWVLDSQTHYYSDMNGEVSWENKAPMDYPAIKYRGKIGLVMKEPAYKPILDGFFLAQRLPDQTSAGGRTNLEVLVDRVESVEGIVILPLDLEAPYVGSLLGGEFWRRFLAEIKERGLEKNFLSFSDCFPELEAEAVETADTPYRNISKWVSLPANFSYYSQIREISQRELTENEKFLLAIAGNSDIGAAIHQKTLKPVARPAVYANGAPGNVTISGSEEVIKASYMALDCLIKGGSLFERLQALDNKGLFLQRLMDVCKRLKI